MKPIFIFTITVALLVSTILEIDICFGIHINLCLSFQRIFDYHFHFFKLQYMHVQRRKYLCCM